MSAGVERSLSEVADSGLEWVHVGQVVSVESHAKWGYLLNCLVRPDGRAVQARPLAPGVWTTYGADDEVVLLFPAADPNRAVAMGRLPSGGDPAPDDWGNSQPVFTHPNGLEVRQADGNGVSGVVISDEFLADLKAVITALITFMTSTAPHTPVSPTVGPAAGAFNADGSAASLLVKLTTSVAAGPGLPYASQTLKTE